MILIKKMLLYLFIIAIILAIITGLLPQTQMVVLGGRVLIPQIFSKVILIFSLTLLAISSKVKIKFNKLMIIWWIFVVYLLIHALILSASMEFSFNSLLFSYNAYYFYLLLIPFYFFICNSIEEKTILKILLTLFVPLALLGIAQFLLNKSLIPTISNDGKFIVFSQIWYGENRAFSLFTSSMEFGNFINILIPIILVLYFRNKGAKKIFLLFLILIGLFASYATLTRNVYLGTVFSCFATLVISNSLKRKKKRRIITKTLPIVFGLIGLGVTYSANLVSSLFGEQGITSSVSMQMRLTEWSVYGSQWLKTDLMTTLFGTGVIQNNKFDSFSTILIDNNFLAIGYHIGIIGLSLWVLIMYLMWSTMLKKTIQNSTVLNIGLTSFFSTWIASGIFNINIYIYPLVFILLIISGKEKTINQKQNIYEDKIN